MAKIYRIAIVLGHDASYSRQILRGITSCPRHPYHVVFSTWPVDAKSLPRIRNWQPDGIIANINYPELADGLLSMGLPIVNVADKFPEIKISGDIPRVKVDDRAVGEMAADYFLQRGFRNFAFSHFVVNVHPEPFPFSADRYAGFSQALERAGFFCQGLDAELDEYDPPSPRPYLADNPEERWLRALPKPVAILAANDGVGARILDTCMFANLRVPEDIAVLGVDNDDVTCLMSEVALSSVETPTVQVGVQAMALMKRLLAGENIPDESILLPPLRVVERLSTNKLAVADESVAAAIQYIRDHLSESVGVDEIAEAIMVSRRHLEMKFRDAMQQSPLEQIRQERFDQARRMLVETDLSVTEIAQRVGLSRAASLSKLFAEKCQMTASTYREKHRPAIRQEFSPQSHRGAEKREDKK